MGQSGPSTEKSTLSLPGSEHELAAVWIPCWTPGAMLAAQKRLCVPCFISSFDFCFRAGKKKCRGGEFFAKSVVYTLPHKHSLAFLKESLILAIGVLA